MIPSKDVIVACSLANLCLIPVWNRLLYPSARFSMDYSPAAVEYAASLCSLGLLTAFFLLLAVIYRKVAQKQVFRKGALLGVAGIVVLVPLNWLRLQAALRFQHFSLHGIFNQIGSVAVVIIILLTAFAMLVTLLRWHDRMLRIVIAFLLIVSPFCLLTAGQSLSELLQGETSVRFAERPTLPLMEKPASQKARVLIVIFDEMDQRLAFDDRAPVLSMPEFDRLRKEAFYAGKAFPPAMNTIQSMPAFTTGRLVKDAWPANQQELLLDYEGAGELLPWSRQPNLFNAAQGLALNTALVGRAIPYSRIIGGSLTKCLLPDAGPYRSAPMTLATAVRWQMISVLGTLPLAVRLDLQGKLSSRTEKEAALKQAIALHQSNLAQSKEVAVDPRYSLVLVHYDVPHQPWIYDHVKVDYSWSGTGSYLDNLMLADRTLGSLRREMERAGVWNSTHLLVTSDHWLRSNGRDKRVPFFLKLAGQPGAVHYDKPINTILCFDLVNALLTHNVSTYPSLVSWFDKHRTIGPSPFY